MEPNAVFTSEQLGSLCAEESFRDALGLWLAEGAITWNPWQAGLAVIRARYLSSDPEASPPEGVAYSMWSQKLWSDLSEEVLGPEWRKKLTQGRLTPRLPQSGAPRFWFGCREDAAADVEGGRSLEAIELVERRGKGAAR